MVDRLRSHNKLVSWSQRKCEKCKRFLGRLERRYCSNCRIEAEKEVSQIYYLNHKEIINIRSVRNRKLRGLL